MILRGRIMAGGGLIARLADQSDLWNAFGKVLLIGFINEGLPGAAHGFCSFGRCHITPEDTIGVLRTQVIAGDHDIVLDELGGGVAHQSQRLIHGTVIAEVAVVVVLPIVAFFVAGGWGWCRGCRQRQSSRRALHHSRKE